MKKLIYKIEMNYKDLICKKCGNQKEIYEIDPPFFASTLSFWYAFFKCYSCREQTDAHCSHLKL